MARNDMPFRIIDYSETCYKTQEEKGIPARRGGKFIQILHLDTGDEYLVLSPAKMSAYHANIVERFCLDMKIEGSYNAKKDRFSIADPAWEVLGGGVWNLNLDVRRLVLSGWSMSYGPFRADGLSAKIGATALFPGCSIIIDRK